MLSKNACRLEVDERWLSTASFGRRTDWRPFKVATAASSSARSAVTWVLPVAAREQHRHRRLRPEIFQDAGGNLLRAIGPSSPDVQIVHDQDYQAVGLRRQVVRHVAPHAGRKRRVGGVPALVRDLVEGADGLRLLAIEQREVRGRQSADRTAVLVHDDDVHLDEIDLGPKHRRLRLRRQERNGERNGRKRR